MKHLILLNNFYPYGYGESFLENEIPIITDTFDRILVLPISILGDMKKAKTRELPENVQAFPAGIKEGVLIKVGVLLKNLPNIVYGFYNLLDCMHKDYAWYRFRKILPFLELYRSVPVETEIVIYSYWFYTHTSIGIFIKAYLNEIGFKNVKIVSRAHGYDVYRERQVFRYFPQRRYMLDNIDRVYVCSRQGRDYIAKGYPEYSDNIVVGRLGSSDLGVCEYKMGKETVVVSCSNVIPLKQVTKIADAISKLLDEGYEIKWHHFGDGSDIGKVKKIVSKYLKKNVILHGRVQNSEVYDFYRNVSVDIFINASTTEGIPVSIMEAMSFGTPIIAPDVGGIREIVNEESGYMLLGNNITSSDIRNALERFIKLSYEERCTIRNRVRKYWEHNYSAEKNYSDFANSVVGLFED